MPVFIVWFRQDLRLAHNPALAAALRKARAHNAAVLPLYILDDVNSGAWAMGAASRWWLHQSLEALDKKLGGNLWLFAGDPQEVLKSLQQHLAAAGEDRGPAGAGRAEWKVTTIYWNRCYEPWRIQRDAKLEARLKQQGVAVHHFKGSLLWEPSEALKADGSPYRVFTPYYKHVVNTLGLPPLESETADKGTGPEPSQWFPCQQAVNGHGCPQPGDKLSRLGLLPKKAWYKGFETYWQPGEAGAQAALAEFLGGDSATSAEVGLADYPQGRDFPARPVVSRLSPHLRFGEIAPKFLAWHVLTVGAATGREEQAEQYLRQLVWREFSYSLLTHFPGLPEENYNPKFNAFPWRQDEEALARWQQGRTGFPIIDAGMRELWQTGTMHNRVRMLVASFLTKNLLLDWRQGARWFWDCLVDADLANNSMGWQWVAGCGLDAAPYFRVFNPVTQSQKFDPEGRYIKRYVPELQGLTGKALHDPGNAPPSALATAGVQLGHNYPPPMVDLKSTRERSLAAYKKL